MTRTMWAGVLAVALGLGASAQDDPGWSGDGKSGKKADC